MKVAIVGPYPPPGLHITGGVERVIDILLQHLPAYADVTLIVPNSTAARLGSAHGVPIIYMARSPGPGALAYWTADAHKLARILASLKPDIVHFHGVAGIGRAVRQPRLITVHGIAERDIIYRHSKGSLLRTVAARVLSKLVKAIEIHYRRHIGNVILINPYVQAVLEDVTFLNQFSIPNPIDNLFCRDIVTNRLRNRRVISMGRIGVRKNTAFGVEIAARALATDDRATAVFFGEVDDPQELRKCRDIAEQFGVSSRITFPGNICAKDIRTELDSSSIFLMTSRQETAPVAIAEAHARGLAVLAPDAFGISNMITSGVNGFFLTDGSAEIQAGLVGRALDHPWNRESISAHAISLYDPNLVSKSTFAAYEKILAAY